MTQAMRANGEAAARQIASLIPRHGANVVIFQVYGHFIFVESSIQSLIDQRQRQLYQNLSFELGGR